MRATAPLLATILFTLAAQLHAADPQSSLPPIVPAPIHYEAGVGAFHFTHNTTIAADPELVHVADYFSDLLAPALSGKMPITPTTPATAPAAITLHLSAFENRLGAEGYHLVVTQDHIDISAAAPAGAFYAIQTLRDMMPAAVESHQPVDALTVPACDITDQPRFPWRGAMLDVARHFFPKETILREIDLLALHKMNVLHLHLNDDQGWRIEIKRYPQLTEVGAWRNGEMTGLEQDWHSGAKPHDMSRYGGFYTQDDLREIVAYAKARYIAVVPEVEMPAHCNAALRSYPELACTAGGAAIKGKYVYCAGKEETFAFIENVLDEICDIFPGTYIHVGGDECDKDRWKLCPLCQQRMKDNGLKNEDELQSYFIKRIEAYLETKHRRLIGWNEILQGGLPANATVMSWQGTGDSVRKAAGLGHDVVMSPESHCYFDHFTQGSDDPAKIDYFLMESNVPLNKVYSFDPTSGNLTAEQAKHVLGAQCNLWTERVPNQDRIDLMRWPRTAALAEALWTGDARPDYAHFAQRLQRHFARLDALGVKYYNDPMVRADIVWSWSPDLKLPTETKTVEADITKTLASPGNYDLWFTFLDGEQRLDTSSITLLENGHELMHDTHDGFAGTESHHNLYRLKIDELHAGESYTLRIAVAADGGPDTRGQLLMAKNSGEIPPTTQP